MCSTYEQVASRVTLVLINYNVTKSVSVAQGNTRTSLIAVPGLDWDSHFQSFQDKKLNTFYEQKPGTSDSIGMTSIARV